MKHTDSLFPIALRGRRRRPLYVRVALLGLPALGLLPILDMAQASRQRPDPASEAPLARPGPIDRPATITLGALIEIQRRERAQRRARAAAELPAADLPSGEAWQAQLGAFRSADAAERQRTRLIEAANLPVVVRQAGALHRLESRPALRADTETLCERAQASGIDCFVRRAADAT